MFSLDGGVKYWLYNKPVDMRKSFNGLSGIVTNGMCASLRSGDTARKLIGGYRGAVQTDGYEEYESFEKAPGKRMIGCWAHVRRKFVEALDEDRKHASEAIVYISKLYKLEAEMKEAGLDADAVRERREKEAYPIIKDFEKWMNSVAGAGQEELSLLRQPRCGCPGSHCILSLRLLQGPRYRDQVLLEDTLRRLPTEEDITVLLPENWQPVTAK